MADEQPTPVQLWPEFDVRLSEALRAALALPGVFEPVRVVARQRRRWLAPDAVDFDLPRINELKQCSLGQKKYPGSQNPHL